MIPILDKRVHHRVYDAVAGLKMCDLERKLLSEKDLFLFHTAISLDTILSPSNPGGLIENVPLAARRISRRNGNYVLPLYRDPLLIPC